MSHFDILTFLLVSDLSLSSNIRKEATLVDNAVCR